MLRQSRKSVLVVAPIELLLNLLSKDLLKARHAARCDIKLSIRTSVHVAEFVIRLGVGLSTTCFRNLIDGAPRVSDLFLN